jgi:lipoprotein-anchoring transpeptidase ErfK/SrfK
MRFKTLAGLGIIAAFAVSTTTLEAKTKFNFSGTDFNASPSSGKKSSRTYRGYGYKGKTTVSFSRRLRPGTILIKTNERRLYFVLPGGKAIKYGVGVGRTGFSWRGRKRISRKVEWPSWTPPAQMRAREAKKGHILPVRMEGGPSNPLGARAMYLGGSLYRIHGTNASYTIGGAVSSGCIRMLNSEVKDLYKRVKIGTLVIVE